MMYVSTDQVTVGWQHPNDDRITHYEVQALWIDQEPAQVIDLGSTAETSMIVEMPRVGHFVIRVRSVAQGVETEDGEPLTSVWAVSSVDEFTAGEPWRVYFAVPSVDGITVD